MGVLVPLPRMRKLQKAELAAARKGARRLRANDVGGLAEKHLRRWFYLGALTVTLAVLVVVMGPCKAGAAGWTRLRYVTQGPAVGPLEGQRWAPPGPWQPAALYAGPAASSGAPTLPAPGDTGVAWVSTSEAWRAGGYAYRVRAGGSPWSNLRLYAVGVPDTFLSDVAGGRTHTQRARPNAVNPALLEVTWLRAPGDTVLVPGPIWHEEQVQLAHRCGLCATYGYVALRGVENAAVCDTAVCP